MVIGGLNRSLGRRKCAPIIIIKQDNIMSWIDQDDCWLCLDQASGKMHEGEGHQVEDHGNKDHEGGSLFFGSVSPAHQAYFCFKH